jgi:hypothetical protein
MIISSLGASSFNPAQRIEHKGHHKPSTPSDLFSRLSSLTGGDGSSNIKKADFDTLLSKLDPSSPHAKPLQDLKAKFDQIAGDDGEISKADLRTAFPHAKPLQDLKAKFDQIAGDDGEISKAELRTAFETGVLQSPLSHHPHHFPKHSGAKGNWNFQAPDSLSKEQLTLPLDFKI